MPFHNTLMGKPTCKRKKTKTNTFYVYFHGCAVVQAKDEEEAHNIVIGMSNEEIGKYVEEIDDVQKEDNIYEEKCENTNCDSDDTELHKIKLTSDFDNEECTWCSTCMKRDRDMIKKIIK